MNATNGIELILGIGAVIAMAYRVGQVEAKIYKNLDAGFDVLLERSRTLEKDLAIHTAKCAEKDESVKFLFHQLDSKIDHKFTRLHDGQRQV